MKHLIKTEKEIEKIRIAGNVLAKVLAILYKMIVPGVTGSILAKKAFQIMKNNNCEPNFLNYQGFTSVICVSINHELIHGIPDNRPFCKGDLISVDAGCQYQGMHADAAFTKIVDVGSEEDKKLLQITKKSLNLVTKQKLVGHNVGFIGHLISSFINKHNYFLTNHFCGHGIGKKLHEPPEIFNVSDPNSGMILQANMVICVEPMVLQGNDKISILPDGWTVISKNYQNNCHFEHMLLIKNDGCEILTPYEKYL